MTLNAAADGQACRRALAQAERLKALWKLATRRDLGEEARFQAMLEAATEALGMDLAVLGEIGDHYTPRFVHDTLGVLTQGARLALDDTICQAVHRARQALYIPDLRAHPELHAHPLATDAGLRVYAGIPVWSGGDVEGVLLNPCPPPPDSRITP